MCTFLGVITENKPTSVEHINQYTCKSHNRILTNSCVVTLCYLCWVYFHIWHWVWQSVFGTHCSNVAMVQKKTVRSLRLSYIYRLAHTKPISKSLNILTSRQLYTYSIQMFTSTYACGLLPSISDNMFNFNKDIHSYQTWQSRQSHLLMAILEVGSMFALYKG